MNRFTLSGKPFDVECVVTNRLSKPLVIESVTFYDPHCSWNEPSSALSKRPIMGGEQVELKLTCRFNSYESGHYSKGFAIKFASGSIVESVVTGQTYRTQKELDDAETSEKQKQILVRKGQDDFADCSPFRMDELGGSMEKIKPKWQKSGTCGGHAATQMYDAWRFKQKKHDPRWTSASLAEAEYKASRKENEVDSVRPDKVLEYLKKHQPCSIGTTQTGSDHVYEVTDQYFGQITALTSSKIKQLSEEYGNTVIFNDEWQTWIKQEIERYSKLKKSKNVSAAEKQQYQSNLEYLEFLKSVILSEKSRFESDSVAIKTQVNQSLEKISCSNGLPANSSKMHNFKDIVDFIGQNKQTYNLKNVVGAWCPDDSRISSKSDYKVMTSANPLYLFNKHFLEKEKSLPVELSYCAIKMFRLSPRLDPRTNEYDNCGAHSSIIVGRRRHPKTNVCEFLIRNTWGDNTCKRAGPYECDKKSSSVWVPLRDIRRNALGYTVIE